MPLDLDEQGRRVYRPAGDVLKAYLRDRSPVSIIRGPLGSGTSSASVMKLAYLATQSPPWLDGTRRSRWFVIRNTYAELKGSTLETWKYWLPEERYGRIVLSRPMIHEVRFADVSADFVFIALDGDDDVSKLRSWEFNGGWINELQNLGKPVFDEAHSRCRWPPVVDIDHAPTWRGVIADMNAASEDHWVPQMMGEVPYPDETPDEKRLTKPDNWGYFVQPGAVTEVRGVDGSFGGKYTVNTKAENFDFLPPRYYEDMIPGKTRDWIRSRLMNEIVTVVDGDPVWPMFKRETHTIAGPLAFNPNYVVFVALDFGRRPAALMMQEINGRVQIQREYRDYGVGAATFAPALKRFMTQNYPGARLEFTGDPKGQDKGQADERTAYEIFESLGMKIRPAPVKNNHLETRLEVVSYALQQAPMGHSRILISATGCPTLVAGMAGKYHLRKMETGDAEPVKDKYSDVCDCLGYGLLHLGDGRRMIGSEPRRAVGPVRVSREMKSLRRVS